MTGDLIEISHLNVRYRTDRGLVSALDDVSFTIPKGASVGLVGESGSGKSTIALAMMRLLPPNARVDGSIRFDGTELTTLPNDTLDTQWRWNRMAMVFQKSLSALSPVHRIGDQMDDVLRLRQPQLKEQARREQIGRVLTAVRLPDRVLASYPFELSGGMMQRTMIALALVCDPPFVIFDEATTALDVITQGQILREIRRLRDEFSFTSMVISHDVGVINAICDHVAVLYAGQVMEVAPRGEFFANARHPYSQALIRSIPRITASTERIRGIPGTLPDLANPPAGCRFAPRCPHATDGCMTNVPPLVEVAPRHWVRCLDVPMPAEVSHAQ